MKDNIQPQPILMLVHSSVSKILKTPEEIYTEAEIDAALGQLCLNTLSEGEDLSEIIPIDDIPPPPTGRQGLPAKIFSKKNSADLPRKSNIIPFTSLNPF